MHLLICEHIKYSKSTHILYPVVCFLSNGKTRILCKTEKILKNQEHIDRYRSHWREITAFFNKILLSFNLRLSVNPDFLKRTPDCVPLMWKMVSMRFSLSDFSNLKTVHQI